MDRAGIIRSRVRPLLLAVVVIQAMTPDFLDYALLSQSLPPGPVFAISSLVAPTVGASLGEALFPEGCFAVGGSTAGLEADASLEGLCQPFWPEVGVTRVHGPGSPGRDKLRADWTATPDRPIDGATSAPARLTLSPGARLPLLLCRFLC